MPRFFINPHDKEDTKVILSGPDVTHITKVLRLGIGDLVELCDGVGNDYLARIESTRSGLLIAHVEYMRSSYAEPVIDVTLYQSISKGEKMDEVIQKCVELGVKRIVPMISKRTIVKLNNINEARNKTDRWAKIAREAAKQSGRGIIPEVELPLPFNDVLISKGQSLGLVASEHEVDKGLKEVFDSASGYNQNIAILAGPEGGWELSELDEARKNGWIPFTLGPRVLRTETAGMTVVSIIMFLAGEMRWKEPAKQKWHSVR